MNNKVLFVTQTLGHKAACGIGLIGKLLSESLIKSTEYEFHILFSDSPHELEAKILECDPAFIIYNYHSMTTKWVNAGNLRAKYNNIKHIMIHHDINKSIINDFHPSHFFGFNYIIAGDTTLTPSDNVFLVSRLIPPYRPTNYPENEIPVIGFQGFGQRHKGIHRIAEVVQREFDTAIIRLHIPYSIYGDPHGNEAHQRVAEVRSIITNPNISVEASHNLLSTEDIIDFLASNTINCYFYDYLEGSGLASSPDYALAANRPLAVTKSHQMRNFIGLSPSICIEDNSLKDIISFGLEPTKGIREKYSEANVIKEYESILKHLS